MKSIMELHFTHCTGLGKRGSEESRTEQEGLRTSYFSLLIEDLGLVQHRPDVATHNLIKLG